MMGSAFCMRNGGGAGVWAARLFVAKSVERDVHYTQTHSRTCRQKRTTTTTTHSGQAQAVGQTHVLTQQVPAIYASYRYYTTIASVCVHASDALIGAHCGLYIVYGPPCNRNETKLSN